MEGQHLSTTTQTSDTEVKRLWEASFEARIKKWTESGMFTTGQLIFCDTTGLLSIVYIITSRRGWHSIFS